MAAVVQDSREQDEQGASQAAGLGAELEAAEEAVAEHARLTARLDRARAALAGCEQEVDRRSAQAVREAQDVQRLESFGTTRIWAVLRGRHDEELSREKAEQLAAEYAVVEAEQRARTARGEVDAVVAEIGRLGDVVERRRSALESVAGWLAESGHVTAERVDALAQERAAAVADQRETEEAIAAADAGLDALGRAAQALSSAGGWATWDTFGGGGLLTDMAKYRRMDEAQALMGHADRALHRLSDELADLGLRGVGGLEISQLARAMDVWFDNIFTDWAVRDRIAEARSRVDQALRAVHEVRARLVERHGANRAALARLVEQRDDLLAEAVR